MIVIRKCENYWLNDLTKEKVAGHQICLDSIFRELTYLSQLERQRT